MGRRTRLIRLGATALVVLLMSGTAWVRPSDASDDEPARPDRAEAKRGFRVAAESVEPEAAEAAVPQGILGAEIPGSDTSTINNPDNAGYGKPNQSRVWHNSAANRWDALVPRNDGGSSASDHYIVVDLTGTPTFTSTELEDRNSARPDVFWDDAAGVLYVFSSDAGDPRFWRVTYDSGSDTYLVDPTVDGVSVPGIAHAPVTGVNCPGSVYVGPDGRVWVAVMKPGVLGVQTSADGGQSWLPVPLVLDARVHTGLTSWTHFTDSGTTYVGLFASENGENGVEETQFYYWFIDQTLDVTQRSNWVNDSANIPGAFGIEQSDDHVSAARDSQENQYFVVKTEDGDPADPVIKLFRRTPQGVWSQFSVIRNDFQPRQSRPSLAIDEQNGKLFVFLANTGGGDGNRKKVPLDQLELLENAPLFPLIDDSDDRIDDLLSPRHAVDSTTGVTIIAHNESDRTMWTASEAIVASGPADPDAVADMGTVDEGATLMVAAPGVLTNDDDPQGDPITARLVSGASHGAVTLMPDGSYEYVHDGSETSSDSFAYEAVDDGGATSETVLVSLTVNPVNDAPVAVADRYVLEQGTTRIVNPPGVLGNDLDVEDDPLTAHQITPPAVGTLMLNLDGSFEYTHDGSATLEVTFTYEARDPSGAASDPGTVTLEIVVPTGSLIPGSDTSTIDGVGSEGYGKPNQSRLWFNRAAGRWDALVPRNDGGESASDHYIVMDLQGTPTFSSVEIEERNDTRPDVYWDEESARLYVLGSHDTDTLIWAVDYDLPGDEYSIDPMVTAVTVPGIAHDNRNNPAVVHRSPNGNVWVSVMRAGALQIQRSVDGGATWMPTPLTLNAGAIVGVTAWSDFVHGGSTYVGLFAGEDGDQGQPSSYSFWFIDEGADASVPASWTDDSANLPDPLGAEQADNHVSAARDSAGNQYFVVRTEPTGPTDPLIKLYRRTPSGLWSQFTATELQDSPAQTRPSLAVDTGSGAIYVFTTDVGAGTGRYKKASLEDLASLKAAPFVTVFDSIVNDFDDIMTPKHAVDAASDLIVIAHSESAKTVWSSVEAIEADVCVSSQDGVAQLVDRTIPQADLAGSLSARIYRPDPALQLGACPLITAVPPMGGAIADIEWAAERLAADGYVVIAVEPVDATSASVDRAARSGIDYMESVDNPWPEATDLSNVGGLGGPVASAALTLTQESDSRFDVVVEWDNLAKNEDGDAGSPLCIGGGGADRTPFVPAMGQASDSCAGNPQDKKTAYEWWRSNGVESMQLVFADATTAWWEAAGSDMQHDWIHHYTLAWFDRWLKDDPSARARLVAENVEGASVAALLDDFYGSAAFFDGLDCPELRDVATGAPEVCTSGIDENCDGQIDCQDVTACPAGGGITPGVIKGVGFSAAPHELGWQAAFAVDAYDILWGDLDELVQDGGFARSRCLAWRVDSPEYVVETDPAAGDAWYFLVRAKRDPCVLGTWGSPLRDVVALTCP